jgi:predicted transcriptional regulator
MRELGQLIRLASSIVITYVSHNSVPATELPEVTKTVHLALGSLLASGYAPQLAFKPAVPVQQWLFRI